VLAYVCRHAYRLWIESPWNQSEGEGRLLSLDATAFGWLVLAAGVYAAGWLPSVWFWGALMRAVGGRVRFVDTARAYYCGHLGKYIPGKAMVLVVRAALVKDRGCRTLPAAVTASYETLTMMGTGLAVGAALAPLLFREWLAAHGPATQISPVWQTVAAAFVVTVLVAGSLPLASKFLTWVATKVAPGGSVESDSLHIPSRLIAAGCGAFVVSWAVQGLSLGLVLHAVTGTALAPAAWPVWTGATALSTSLGFAVLFAPAGLGVREAILLGVLNGQPGVDPHTAVAATVLSRIVSFVAEILVSAAMYWSVRTGPVPLADR
jgi:glycosyltransferase 2 family protein